MVEAASDEFSYNITSGKVTVTCHFKFVYKLGGSRIDLRRSMAECDDLPRTIKVKDYAVSSECGSIFTISLTATKKATTLTSGTVAPSKGCKPTAPPPTTTMKPKPKRKCPYGTTYICPSFQDGSCLPKQVAVCFKEGKMGKAPMMEERDETTMNKTMMPYKPTKEEKEEVMAGCMCLPNVALYGGALSLIAPDKKPGKGKGKQTTPTAEERERSEDYMWDRVPTRAPRATCNEKFSKNFKEGKQVVKCKWVLVYTDQALDLKKSKATCTKGIKSTIKAKDVEIKTTCGSVITMDVTVSKKTVITKGQVTSVGTSCKCYVVPTTTTTTTTTTGAQTTTTTTATVAATTPTPKGGGGKGTTPGGGKGKGTTPGGGKGKGTTPGGGKGKGTTPNGGGGPSPQKNVYSPRFMNECACIEQGAIKKGQTMNE